MTKLIDRRNNPVSKGAFPIFNSDLNAVSAEVEEQLSNLRDMIILLQEQVKVLESQMKPINKKTNKL